MSLATLDQSAVQLPGTTPTREEIQRFEDVLMLCPQVGFKTEHNLSGGIYARTIHIPTGGVLTGATHKHDHINVMHGDITVWTEQGMKRLTGYHVLPTKAGAKRAGFAHSDTTWTTLCATQFDSLDELQAIEAELVEEADQLQTRNPALPMNAPTAALEG